MKNKSKHRFYREKHRFTIDNFIYTPILYKSDCWESLFRTEVSCFCELYKKVNSEIGVKYMEIHFSYVSY